MKKIPLTRDKFALVDDEDFERINKYKWYATKPNSANIFYAVRTDRGKRVYMHRFILGLSDSYIICDHKDSNGLNNQKINLRECTQSLNRANQRKGIRRTSKYKGVCYLKHKNRWLASIQYQGRAHYIGYFRIEIEAALAYNKKAIELFGEFAKPNTI